MNFQPYIEKGLITRRRHPLDDSLEIYNYTAKTQFHGRWDPITRRARGLIIHKGKIVAEPFHKFFNLEERPETQLKNLPPETPEITEKIDGALGILYLSPDGKLAISTRGSFESEEALWATEFFREKILLGSDSLNCKKISPDPITKRYTIMFEIAGPTAEHVLRYPDGIYLIGVRDLWSPGKPLLSYSKVIELGERLAFPVFPNFIVDTPLDLLPIDTEDIEGWVAMYPKAQFLLKVKTKRYHQIHRDISAVTVKNILDLLEGGTYDDAVFSLPPEVKLKANQIRDDLIQKYIGIEKEIYKWYQKIPSGSRKKQAAWMNGNIPADLRGLVFILLDGKSPFIWKPLRKLIKQEGRKEIGKRSRHKVSK